MSLSWSDNRSIEIQHESVLNKLNHLRNINGILKQLSNDEDLHDYLKEDKVLIAIHHWTGQRRLPSEESCRLQNYKPVMYVFERLGKLQMICKEAQMGVPLDHFLQRFSSLQIELVIKVFGEELLNHSDFPKDIYQHQSKIKEVFSSTKNISGIKKLGEDDLSKHNAVKKKVALDDIPSLITESRTDVPDNIIANQKRWFSLAGNLFSLILCVAGLGGLLVTLYLFQSKS